MGQCLLSISLPKVLTIRHPMIRTSCISFWKVQESLTLRARITRLLPVRPFSSKQVNITGSRAVSAASGCGRYSTAGTVVRPLHDNQRQINAWLEQPPEALVLKRMKMRKFHIAISTANIEATIEDYSRRLDALPCSLVRGEYALWRTESLNVSVRHDPDCASGSLRHLGWEDPAATEFTRDTDVNGIIWERFAAQHQAEEINQLWPEARYRP